MLYEEFLVITARNILIKSFDKTTYKKESLDFILYGKMNELAISVETCLITAQYLCEFIIK
jgi:hypothetical protein